ncbi:MAG: pyridoxamine 5'-phosphate oxidase family protein [Deltaproteobacteria bacterium]|nr:pyridoxamine 5'-phosphate oxidase family protein [Deltaproteobacteria bacterium]
MATSPSATAPTDADHRAHLYEILDSAGTVVVITRAADGQLHPRPMAVVRVDEDGTTYFVTPRSSTKVAELEADPRVDLVFQSRTRYASISGRGRLVNDRAMIEALWTEGWRLWFPEGKQDPEITLLAVDPEHGEYWDQSGTRGLSFLLRAARAYVTGTTVEPRPEDHGATSM